MKTRADRVGKKLVAAARLVRTLKEIPLRAIHEQQIRRVALGIEIADSAVFGEAHFKQRVVPPQLIFYRRKQAVAGFVQRGRLWMQRVEPHAGVAFLVVEQGEMQAAGS